MRAIEATTTISRDRKLAMPVSREILPGEHRMVVVIDERASEPPLDPAAIDLPVHDVGPWPAGWSLRREDLYGDDGR
ncbi:MAG: hypothetical protein ACYDA8_09900 [Deferrisomatales bacterium]